jgi:HPt (histidine-containing phosphotransfer) domain-containing protein
MAQRRGGGSPDAPSGGSLRPHFTAVAILLSLVAAAVPLAIMLQPELRSQMAPPRLANLLLGFLLSAPAALGLATAVSGRRRVSRFDDDAGRIYEPAVLRILVAALLFGHAAIIGGLSGPSFGSTKMLLTSEAALVVGWLILLALILWPAASAWLRRCSVLIDAALLSLLLHFGGQEAAGWYPLYLLLIAYAGFRFGIGALVGNATFAVLGFGAVAATTAFWQHQPALTAECGFALLLLPLLAQGPVRAIAEARASAIAAEKRKSRFVTALAESLRGTLFGSPHRSLTNPGESEFRDLPPQIADILDLAAIEAGTYAPRTESFDLHELVNDALLAGRAMAESKGVALRGRIDPYVPYMLRGWRQSFDRILGNLLSHAIETAASGTVQLRLSMVDRDGDQVRLALTIESLGDVAPLIAASSADPFTAEPAAAGQPMIGLALVRRAVELMGGTLTLDTSASGRARVNAELSFAIDKASADPPLQSADCPVLIVTGDSVFAGNVCEYLSGWDAPVSWIGESDAALNYIAWLDPAVRAVLVVDGRARPLSAMTFIERAAGLDGTPPFAVLVAERLQIAALAELDDGEVAAFLSAPVDPHLLANALHALPLRADAAAQKRGPHLVADTDPAANDAAPFAERVTPIAAHPRFAAEATPIVDQRRIEALRELGGQEGFLGDLVETFRTDAQQIMRRLQRAAAVADVTAFAQGLRALGQAAGHIGALPLAQLTASLRSLNAGELRDQGSPHLQRLEAEIERLAVALQRYVDPAEAQRP